LWRGVWGVQWNFCIIYCHLYLYFFNARWM